MNSYTDFSPLKPAEACQGAVSSSGSGQGQLVQQEHLEEKQLEQPFMGDGEESSSKSQANIGAEIGHGINNEQMQYWLNLGAELCSLGSYSEACAIPEEVLDTNRSVVDKATAMDLARAVSFKSGEPLMKALTGIRHLSDYRYGCKTPPGAVPALYVEFLLQYQALFADSNYARCSVGLYAVIMQDRGFGVDRIADSLGKGNDTIYAAINELTENGLLLGADRINAPGAGRDDIETRFAHDMTPEIIAAGINPEEIRARKVLKEMEELSLSGRGSMPETDGKEPAAGTTPDGDTQKPEIAPNSANGQQKEAHYRSCEAEEINPHGLKVDTLKAADDAIDVLVIGCEGKKTDVRLLEALKRLKEARQMVDDYYLIACSDEGGDGGDERIAFNLVPDFVEFCDALRRRCDAIIQVKADNADAFDKEKESVPGKGDYWRRKHLHKVVDRKWFLQGLAEEEYRYAKICELLDEVASYAAVSRETSQGKEESAEDRVKRYEENRVKAFSDLEAIIKKMEDALGKTAEGTEFYQKAEGTVKFLYSLREDIARAAQQELSNNYDISILQEVMVSMLGLYAREALEIWGTSKKRRDALKRVVAFFSTKKFTNWVTRTFRTYDKVFQSSQKPQGSDAPSRESAEWQIPEEQHNESTETDEAALNDALTQAQKSLEDAVASFQTLIGQLRIGSGKESYRKNSTGNPIPEAIVYLEGMLESLAKLKVKAENTLSVPVRKALSDMAISLCERNRAWQEMLGLEPKYFQAKQVANTINGRRYHDFCEKQAERALDSGENKGWNADVLGHYKQMFADDPLGLLSPDGWMISPSERREIIWEIWNRGDDPSSLKAWIQYITERNSKNVFGDPTGNVSCCKVTADELSNAVRFLTGCKFSGRSLWDYLTRNMGFTRHQCVKEEQLGQPHPQKDEQYRNIDTLKADAIAKGNVLILSADTKAVVKIGRFKHDNGLLLCSPDGRVYRVCDHDFVFTWQDVCGEGGCPVGKSRLKERAVVHPCAVYDVLANTCHVSFVLGTENSESMANILIKAIKDKLEEHPDIESVLLLSDGGGVNSSNSYIWKNELLRVADETGLRIQAAHYPPGCSRHNPVERDVFAPISRAWKGKSLHNLEVLAELTCAATTKRSKKGSPLKIKVFIDLRRYKTLKQKTEDGDPIVTKEEFNKNAKGRIIHPFTEEDGAMCKWNYIVLPSSNAKGA